MSSDALREYADAAAGDAALVRRWVREIDAGWQGDAASAAGSAIVPLAVEQDAAAGRAGESQNLGYGQVTGFGDSKTRVVPVPPLPDKPGDPSSWPAPEQKSFRDGVAAHNDAAQQNRLVMSGYERTSAANATFPPTAPPTPLPGGDVGITTASSGQGIGDTTPVPVRGGGSTRSSRSGSGSSVAPPPAITGTGQPPPVGGAPQPIPGPPVTRPGPGGQPVPPDSLDGRQPDGRTGISDWQPPERTPGELANRLTGEDGTRRGGGGPGTGLLPGGPGIGGTFGDSERGGGGRGGAGGVPGGRGGIAPGPGVGAHAPEHGPAGRATGAGAAGMRGGGAGAMGGMPMGGAGARGDEDKEHERPSFLVEPDPDSIFDSDEVTAPATIGVDEDEPPQR
ncbi:hypothetical protein [Herbihabitans rhizosphaerae]|nr:hypothetical protein [Herbihabitans rhizosphaerae]